MWTYMITCYIMSFLTLILVVTAFFQSFLKFSVFHANHITLMILISMVYFFTETLVIFFFVGLGMGIKESTIDHQLDPRFRRHSIAIKRKALPTLVLNLLFMIILFVLAGAVDTHQIPSRVYPIIFLGCLYHFVKSKLIQNQGFKEYTEIVLEMSEIKKE